MSKIHAHSPVTFQAPDAAYTAIYGINDSGEIAGTYSLPAVPPAPTYASAFVDDHGDITTIPSGPGFKGATAQAINNLGQFLVNEGNQYTGDMTLYAKDGTALLTLDNFSGTGINDKGDIVGTAVESTTSEIYSTKTGTTTTIQVPGALNTAATGINDKDEVVGNYQDSSSNWHGFIQIGSKMSFINYPRATQTFIEGVNNSGVVVGYYEGANGNYHNFIDFNGAISKLEIPGIPHAMVYGINDHDQIVGSYASASGTVYGFIASVECSPGGSPRVVLDHHSA